MRIFFTCFMLISTTIGCSQRLTQQDVMDQITEAREDLQEAEDETRKAIAMREQFYEDYKSGKTAELQDRLNKLDGKIKDLKKTSKDANAAAQSDIASAIENLKQEQSEIERNIQKVQNIRVKDWSGALKIIENSAANIRQQIDSLAYSVEDNTSL